MVVLTYCVTPLDGAADYADMIRHALPFIESDDDMAARKIMLLMIRVAIMSDKMSGYASDGASALRQRRARCREIAFSILRRQRASGAVMMRRCDRALLRR